MAGSDEYEIETTLCMIQTVHVFQIPPRSTSGGHRANDWTREVWDGKLKIVQKGSNATVYLLDKHNGNEFAQAPGKPSLPCRPKSSSVWIMSWSEWWWWWGRRRW